MSPAPAKGRRFSRRVWLRTLLYGSPLALAGYGLAVEPGWLRTRRLRLSPAPACRFVHFTDLHHKGDTRLLEAVIRQINALRPDFACFTGDIVEETSHLGEALAALQRIAVPVFGVPGNHDYWSGADFAVIARAFSRHGGAWLLDSQVPAAGGKVLLTGLTCRETVSLGPAPGVRNLALVHYPEWADKLAGTFDLVLAGHSHGGQVRIPFYGPLIVPFGVGRYDLGRFQTAGGPLHVSAGIGWFHLRVRFNCPPEIVVVEV